MRYSELYESPTTMRAIANAKVDSVTADFWIIRRGTPDQVGRPVRDYGQEHIGLSITALDQIYPDYLFYVMEHLWRQGYFKQKARGSTRLVNIRVNDVLDIAIDI